MHLPELEVGVEVVTGLEVVGAKTNKSDSHFKCTLI